MKGHVDLLGPATKVGEELIGIPHLKLLIILNYLQKKKEMVGKLKILMVAGSAVQNLVQI
jgi:hypothetical protein